MALHERKNSRQNGAEISLNVPPKVDGVAPRNDENEGLAKVLDKLQALFDVDVVVYNGPINEDGYGQFVQASMNVKPERKLLMVLITYGGSAYSAYRIARYAQNFFKDFILFVPNACKSAGTLIALGASRIHMSPFGEFGPLDVQVYKSDEIFERRSGLTSKSAVWSLTEEAFKTFEKVLLTLKMRSGGTLTFKAASNVATSIANGLLSPIAAQPDPMALGEDYQNLHIAHEYGDRLVEKFGTVNAGAVSTLVESYPSHGFVIDIFDAIELFGNVEMAGKELIQLQACLSEFCSKPDPHDVTVFRPRDRLEEEIEDENQQSPSAEETNAGRSGEISGRDQQAEQGDRRRSKPKGEGSSGNNGAQPDSAASGTS